MTGPGRKAYSTEFGRLVEQHLTRNGMRARDLASATSVSRTYISRLMTTGTASPEWTQLICDTLGVGPEDAVEIHHAAAKGAGYMLELDLTKKP